MPDSRRAAFLARRADVMAAHPDVTAVAELMGLVGAEWERDFLSWLTDRAAELDPQAVNHA